MSILHRITGLIMAALIVLTAQSAAVARTMPDATGQMVICTGTGPVMVYVDEEGAPTAPPHICPDFALSLLLALDAPQIAAVASGGWSLAHVDSSAASLKPTRLGAPQARGPPVLS